MEAAVDVWTSKSGRPVSALTGLDVELGDGSPSVVRGRDETVQPRRARLSIPMPAASSAAIMSSLQPFSANDSRIPGAPGGRPDGLPRHLEASVVQKLLEAVRGDCAIDLRDHAMLLLMARLGLRAQEVVEIRLDDIDWGAGQMLVRGKGRQFDRVADPCGRRRSHRHLAVQRAQDSVAVAVEGRHRPTIVLICAFLHFFAVSPGSRRASGERLCVLFSGTEATNRTRRPRAEHLFRLLPGGFLCFEDLVIFPSGAAYTCHGCPWPGNTTQGMRSKMSVSKICLVYAASTQFLPVKGSPVDWDTRSRRTQFCESRLWSPAP